MATAAHTVTTPAVDSGEPPQRESPSRLGKIARELTRYTILVVASAISLYPVLWLLSAALKSQAEYVEDPSGLPSSISFSNFGEVLGDDQIVGYMLNSLIVVGVAVPVATFIAVLAGYAIARLWGKAGMAILFVFLFSELVPLAIVAIPLLLTVKEIGLDSGLLRVICVYSVLMMGFGVLLSWSFFRSVPEELREAAKLDGCGEFTIFRRIMLPLARSPITLIAVISFIALWNELFLAVVLLDNAADQTLPVGLTELRGRYATNWPKLAAALLLSAIPTLVLYAVFQGRIANQFSRSTVRE